jgi:cell wall-associated NlpC family hydrolase
VFTRLVGLYRRLIPDVRLQIKRVAIEGVTDEATKQEFVYQETRPVDLVWKKPIRIDCSGYCILVYFKAGAHDPTGNGFNGAGNSVTLWQKGKHILRRQLHPGDIVTFGVGGTIHAVICLQYGWFGRDVLCASMGQSGDPHQVRLSVLSGLGEPTFLRFSTRNRHMFKA